MTDKHIQMLSAMGIQVWRARGQKTVPQVMPVSCQVTQSSSCEQATNTWRSLANAVASCTQCPLHETRTQAVFGVGNKQSDIMFIGEAPGQQEDLMGEPFVGRAGKLLDEMLISLGRDRTHVFIANVLKCRPPKNRDPSPEEVATCTHFLDKQIQLIQPKLLVALGRIAAHYLLKTKTPLSRLRGKMHVYQPMQTPLFVTYHPAYLLRAPQDKAKAYQDLLAIADFIQQKTKAMTVVAES